MKEKAVLLPKLIYPVSFTHVLKNNSPGKRNFILPPDFSPQIFYFSIRRNKENRNINVWNSMKKIRTVSGEHIFLHVWNWVNKSFVSKIVLYFLCFILQHSFWPQEAEEHHGQMFYRTECFLPTFSHSVSHN